MRNNETEQHIRETAKDIFFGQGRFNAKLHEIATEAGVNKALLHYYFRDRQTLFEAVTKDAVEESFLTMFKTLASEMDFEKKVKLAITQIITCLAKYPFIESFIISELNRNAADVPGGSSLREVRELTAPFLTEVQNYLHQKPGKQLSAQHFLVNMMALCAYPASTKPVICNMLGLSDQQFNTFYTSRAEGIAHLLLANGK